MSVIWTGNSVQNLEPGPSHSEPAIHGHWAGWNEYGTRRKLGGIKKHIAWPYTDNGHHFLQCGAGSWLKGLACGDQHRLTGSSSALEVCYMWCAI